MISLVRVYRALPLSLEVIAKQQVPPTLSPINFHSGIQERGSYLGYPKYSKCFLQLVSILCSILVDISVNGFILNHRRIKDMARDVNDRENCF